MDWEEDDEESLLFKTTFFKRSFISLTLKYSFFVRFFFTKLSFLFFIEPRARADGEGESGGRGPARARVEGEGLRGRGGARARALKIRGRRATAVLQVWKVW